MNPQQLWRLLKQHVIWFLLLPALTAGTVFWLTRNETKTYQSKATLYTGFASGYTLRSAVAGYHVDYSAVSSAFDNILTTLNSNETLLRVGGRLLAEHLQLTQPDDKRLPADQFARLQQLVPAELRRSLLRPNDPAYTYRMIDSLARSETDNPIKLLLLRSETPYAAQQIGKKLKATRRNSSDMLDLDYEASLPAVAQHTLRYAIAVLNERYTSLKQAESTPVVGYYEDNVQQAKRRLDNAEAKLRAFNVQHKVLNFDEEIKNKALTRESLTSEYNQELMRNQAARAAKDAINQRMGMRGKLPAINRQLIEKQAELTELESRLINARANGQPQPALNDLQKQLDRLAEELKELARTYYAADNSSDAIPQQSLINEWLTRILAYEESSARLSLHKKRLDEFRSEADAYTPLETELRQLTRELTVAEKEYLDLVQALNQARTHRQDISLDGALSVLDAPTYPFLPQPSKRTLFIAVALGAGLFLALVLTAVRFWLDQRIHTPEQAETRIGRPVTAVFPTVKKFSFDSKASRAAQSMFEQLASAINVEVQATGGRPVLITLVSARSKQGKTWVAHGLMRLYAGADESVAYVYPQQSDTDRPYEQNGVHFFPYALRNDFMQATNVADLLGNDPAFLTGHFDKLLLELPALISSPLPVRLLTHSRASVLVVDARSAWRRTERQLLSLYGRVIDHPVLAVVNRVDDQYIDAPSKLDSRPAAFTTELVPAPQPNQA